MCCGATDSHLLSFSFGSCFLRVSTLRCAFSVTWLREAFFGEGDVCVLCLSSGIANSAPWACPARIPVVPFILLCEVVLYVAVMTAFAECDFFAYHRVRSSVRRHSLWSFESFAIVHLLTTKMSPLSSAGLSCPDALPSLLTSAPRCWRFALSSKISTHALLRAICQPILRSGKVCLYWRAELLSSSC